MIHTFTNSEIHITGRGGFLLLANLYCKVHPWLESVFDLQEAKRAYGYPVEGGKMVIHLPDFDCPSDYALHGCKMYSGVTKAIWDGAGEFPGNLMGTIYHHKGELCLVRDIDTLGMTDWEYQLHERYYKSVQIRAAFEDATLGDPYERA